MIISKKKSFPTLDINGLIIAFYNHHQYITKNARSNLAESEITFETSESNQKISLIRGLTGSVWLVGWFASTSGASLCHSPAHTCMEREREKKTGEREREAAG